MRPDYSGRIHVFGHPSNVCFGYLAALFADSSLMAAFEGKADMKSARNHDFE